MDNCAQNYIRFKNGVEGAFDEIMNELFHSLVFFINRYVRDVHTAEDIAIDTFSDLVVHKNRYNFKVSLKTYLFMLGRSRALDYMRRNRKADVASLSEIAEVSDDEALLEEKVLADERKRAVSGAIGQLPQDMRDAVHLIYFEDLTYDEAAKVMKKKYKQVDNLLYRAKKELREILGEEGKLLL
ncbi:MAG: RNA polymerase sigma factor [Clostridia bacterium]|nr:RNA polymerase sigma factor [Clostridia bacterium]MBQ6789468.1 RNA polymerase sigma factor [Clostridia bacterium]